MMQLCLLDSFGCRSPVYNDDEKMHLARQHLEHLDNARKAREHLVSCIAEAKEALLLKPVLMGKKQPQSGPAIGHYSFDFAQQVSNNDVGNRILQFLLFLTIVIIIE